MKSIRMLSVLAAGAMAVMSLSAVAQTTPGPRDPYTQGGATGVTTTNPNAGSARAGDKFDPYTQGAAQPATRRDLAPQPQSYELVPPTQQPGPGSTMGQPMSGRADGTMIYRGDMRWSAPNLGQRVGITNRFLDGA